MSVFSLITYHTSHSIQRAVCAVKEFFSARYMVRLSSIPRSYPPAKVDRDELMFHAMFQILVDFVELEWPWYAAGKTQPRQEKKRCTDRVEMRKCVERLSPSTRTAHLPNHETWWFTSRDREDVLRYIDERYGIEKEILFLYEWYKDKKYEEVDPLQYLFMPKEPLDLDNWCSTSHTAVKGAENDLQHNRHLIDIMLHRVLAVRTHLWV